MPGRRPRKAGWFRASASRVVDLERRALISRGWAGYRPPMGVTEGEEWVMIGLDDKIARKQGLPPQLPIPKSNFEKLADQGLPGDKARKWASDFLNNSDAGKSGAWRKANRNLVVRLETFIDKGPMWDKAQKAFAENDFEKAISTLKKITVLDDEDHSAKLNLASAYANQRNYELALKYFKAVRATFDDDPDYHVTLAQVFLAQGNQDEATNELVLALESKPDHQGALDALTKLGVLARIYENPRDANSLIFVRADAVVDYLEGEWDKETRTLEFYLEQLAYHEREQRFGAAKSAAERAIKAAGEAGSERAEIARISALRALGKADEAHTAAQEFATRSPNSSGAQVELSQGLKARGDEVGALAAIDKALALDPGDLLALQIKFWPDNKNDIEAVHAAVTPLGAFVEKNPTSPGALRSIARAYLVIGRVDDGLDTLKKAVSLKPEDDDLRGEWWTELGRRQRFEEILKDADALGDMKKRDWRLRWNEAEAYKGVGKKVEARACFSAINFDESLHVDIRRRAKRAVENDNESESPATGG
jgi:tetratricopeptide (TPR) repeat protein